MIMNMFKQFACIVISLMVLSSVILADTLVFQNGKVLQGNFKGGTAEALQFEVNGKIENVALSEITSLTFSPREAKAAVNTAGNASGPVTVPAGTKLMLKTKDAVSTASHQKGAKFTAELETDLAVDGQVVVPKGTLVYGTVLE